MDGPSEKQGWNEEDVQRFIEVVTSDLTLQLKKATMEGAPLPIRATLRQIGRLNQSNPSPEERAYIEAFIAGWAGCKIFYHKYAEE